MNDGHNYADYELIILISLIVIIILICIKFFIINGKRCKLSPDLSGQIVIVTGSNCGIGKPTAFRLADLNATVILACRDENKANATIADYQQHVKNQKGQNQHSNSNSKAMLFMRLDLSDLDSVRKFSLEFRKQYKKLNILVNNAGLGLSSQKKYTQQGFEECIGVNHFGTTYLSLLLLPLLQQTPMARVVFVSSKAHYSAKFDFDYFEQTGESMQDYKYVFIYANSKLANVLTSSYLQFLQDNEVPQNSNVKMGIKFVSLHPGLVRTDFKRYLVDNYFLKTLMVLIYPFYWYFTKSCEQGAQNTFFCCLMPFDQLQGASYYSKNGITDLPSKDARSLINGKRLFDATIKILIKKNFNPYLKV